MANENFDHVNLEFTLHEIGGKIKITDLKIIISILYKKFFLIANTIIN